MTPQEANQVIASYIGDEPYTWTEKLEGEDYTNYHKSFDSLIKPIIKFSSEKFQTTEKIYSTMVWSDLMVRAQGTIYMSGGIHTNIVAIEFAKMINLFEENKDNER